MSEIATGMIRDGIVVLDEPMVSLEGKRVRLVIDPIEDADLALSSKETEKLYREWAERGPQGPLSDEDVE